MSEVNTRDLQNNFGTADYDRSKVFIYDNFFEVGTLSNLSGGELTYPIGLVLGRVAADNTLIPLVSTAADGSQYPVGILAKEVTLETAGTADVDFCISGEVTSSLIIFANGTDTTETVIELKTLGDRIKSDTEGVRLRSVNDRTFYDN